jgi:hypothetical protein
MRFLWGNHLANEDQADTAMILAFAREGLRFRKVSRGSCPGGLCRSTCSWSWEPFKNPLR